MKSNIVFLFCALLLMSCKTKTVYVPIESVKTEYRDVFLRDSIHLYDSIFVLQRNDTVWSEKYRYLYRDKIIRDSVYVRDSIPYIREVAVKGDIVYKMKWYEQVVFYIGLCVLLYSALYGAFRYLKR